VTVRPKSPEAAPPGRGLGVLRRYRELLPVTDKTPLITLGEGDTPLVRSVKLEGDAGCAALHFKLELCNPSGSFKDRGMVVAVAKAVGAAAGVLCTPRALERVGGGAWHTAGAGVRHRAARADRRGQDGADLRARCAHHRHRRQLRRRAASGPSDH
jgi:hypothetical protein